MQLSSSRMRYSDMPTNTITLDWLPDLIAFLQRRWRVIAIGAAAFMALAILYMCVASTKYTATTTLLIDTQAAASFQPQAMPADAQYANGVVESQVEVLQSDGLARAVVRKLHLENDPAFLKNDHSLSGAILAPVLGLFSPSGPANAMRKETAAAELLVRLIKVKRIGLSFVIDVAVSSLDPNMSARLVNALADEYVEMGLDAKNSNTRRASDWLQARIGGLHDQAIAADKAAQAFKAKTNIVDTDKGLMNERHLGELNSQLVLARAHTADAKSKYERAEAILKSGDVTGNVTDALQNEVIIHLREAYVDAANRAAEWRSRYGASHQAVILEQGRMRDIQTQLSNELRRIAAGYASDYQEAQASEADLERQLNSLSADASVTNNDLVTLRALQSSADTYKALYENFLQRYTQAVQDQSFPISEARVVTVAMPPLRPSWPKALVVLPAGAVLGLGFGFMLGLVRDATDRGLRTASQVRAVLGLNCLMLLPAVPKPRDTPRITLEHETMPRTIVNPPGIMRHAANMPLSSFGEAVRGLRIRIVQQRNSKRPASVIGCVSVLPGEGKSTVAANFAFFLAQAGFRTLLLDWDMRKPSISRALAPSADIGFGDVVSGRASFADAVWQDPETGLDLLPLAVGDTSVDWLENSGTRQLIQDLRKDYDHIIVDLPATEAVSDAQIAAQLTDGLLLIVEWGRTSQDLVLEWLNSGGVDERNMLGVILNKVDMKMLRSYPAGSSPPGFGIKSRETVV